MKEKTYECCILGAGPAGVGTAHELVKNNVNNILIIDKNENIGGLARTEIFDGVRFDVGPHRFFSKNKDINQLWHDTLGDDFMVVDRLTRIYYKKKYFNYPIKAFDALSKLGFFESFHAMFSYGTSVLFRHGTENTFEQWVTRKFGKKLFDTFFKTYTEKVWGIPCSEIGAEWAAQRIKGLDIFQVLKNSIIKPGKNIKTLVDQFDYPKMGAGQMYEQMCQNALKKGAQIQLQSEVVAFNRKENKISSLDIKDKNGKLTRVNADHFFTSIPLTHFFKLLNPKDVSIMNEVEAMYYRDHITVNIIVDGKNYFPDQWIYIHDPSIKMARLANYNNFSKQMNGKKILLH